MAIIKIDSQKKAHWKQNLVSIWAQLQNEVIWGMVLKSLKALSSKGYRLTGGVDLIGKAAALKTAARKRLWVRVPPPPQIISPILKDSRLILLSIQDCNLVV
jgi:hypothetical protein